MKEIVWLGPMGEDDASKRAKEIVDKSIAPLCKEFGFSLYYPRMLDAKNWFEELFQRIRSSDGVICDLTGGRHNVYFEFGFAYALKIPRILICQSSTEVPKDFANIQYHQYQYYVEVEAPVKEWLAALSVQDNNLSKKLDFLPHPIELLEGNGSHEYVYDIEAQRSSFEIERVEVPFTLDTICETQSDLGSLLNDIHAIQKEIANKTGRVFHQADLYGYVRHKPLRNESGSRLGARIYVRRTDYFTFAASHYAESSVIDGRKLEIIDDATASTLRSRIAEEMKKPTWPFARPLTAMVFLVVEMKGNRLIYFQKRNTHRNFHAHFPLQATAGGMIHPSRIFDGQGRSISPEKAFLDELREETGISIEERTAVKILGLVHETEWHECGLVGYVVAGEDKLINRKLPIDSFESKEFESVSLRPDHITNYLKKAGGGKDLTPMTIAALSLLLINEFGLNKMKEIFQEAST